MAESKFGLKNSPPPYIPIDWQAWGGDEHVMDMSESMEGIYFRIIRELWVYGVVVFDHNVLAQRLHCDRRNMKTFLTKWGHLFRCSECGEQLDYANVLQGRTTKMSGVCTEYVAVTSQSCPYCAPVTSQSCRCYAPSAFHKKLLNYRKDVASKKPLGTIEGNQTEGDLNLTSIPPSAGSESGTSKPKTSPGSKGSHSMLKNQPGSKAGFEIDDETFLSLAMGHRQSYSDPDCKTCYGDGNYNRYIDDLNCVCDRCDCSRTKTAHR